MNNKYNPRALALVLRLINYRGKHRMKEGTICAVLDINAENLKKSLFPFSKKQAYTCNEPSVSFDTLAKPTHVYNT